LALQIALSCGGLFVKFEVGSFLFALAAPEKYGALALTGWGKIAEHFAAGACPTWCG
jgi:hypothetical protein